MSDQPGKMILDRSWLFAGVHYCELVTRFTGTWACTKAVPPGSLIFGKWTWNRGLTCAGYGSYLVAKLRVVW